MTAQLHRELRWIAIKDLLPDNQHIIYSVTERKDLSNSVGESGVIQPFTGIIDNDKTVIIDGRERLKVAREKLGDDYKVPVWVILEPLSDDEIMKLILDIERTRRKTYVDLIAEYQLYDRLIPNQQGKKLDGDNRTLVISGLMGICKSQLMKLRKIDKISPALLQAVDNGHITLEGARRKADEIKRKRQKEFDTNEKEGDQTSGRVFADKEIDLHALPKTCPSCNRSFATIRYEDIQELFNLHRQDEDYQTDWLRDVA